MAKEIVIEFLLLEAEKIKDAEYRAIIKRFLNDLMRKSFDADLFHVYQHEIESEKTKNA